MPRQDPILRGMNPLVYVGWDGDHIGRQVGRARLSDNVEEVRRVDQAIIRGNLVWTSWALSHGGSTVEVGGDEGVVEVPASALVELEAVRHNYETAVEAPASVGVGRKLSESAKALLVAKLQGGDRVIFYDESVEAAVAEAQKKSQNEVDKIGDEYLGKADGGNRVPHLQDLDSYVADGGEECGWCGKQFKADEGMVSTGRSPHNWCSTEHAMKGHHPSSKYSKFMGVGGSASVKGSSEPTVNSEWVDHSNHPAAQQHLRNWPGVKIFVGPLWNGPKRVFAMNMTNSNIEADRELGTGRTSGHASFEPIFDEIERHHASTNLGVNASSNKLQNSEKTLPFSRMKKASDSGKGKTGAQAPTHQAQEHSEAEVARATAAYKAPEPAMAPQDYESHFRAAAETQDTQDRATEARSSADFVALKSQLAQALTGVRAQLPVLAQLRTAYPDTYKSILGLVQAVISLGRQVDSSDAELAKHEKPKSWKGQDGLTIPSYSSPLRAQYDSNYRAKVADTFAGGNTQALRPLRIKLDDIVTTTNGPVNAARHSLYSKMLAAGDKVPHIVVSKLPSGKYRVVDGSHRYFAAKETGTTDLPAYELKPVQKEELDPTLEKDGLPSAHPHRNLELPVGSQHNGHVKVRHYDGKESWRSVRAGQVLAQDPSHHPVSSREPGSK